MSSYSNSGNRGGKGKFPVNNINNVYKGKSVEQQRPALRQYGLQSLGKVSARRVPPPASLPSLRSETGGNDPNVNLVPPGGIGWGTSESASGSAQSNLINPETSSTDKQAASTKGFDSNLTLSSEPRTWSRITKSQEVQSLNTKRNTGQQHFYDFPKLNASNEQTFASSSDVNNSLRKKSFSNSESGGCYAQSGLSSVNYQGIGSINKRPPPVLADELDKLIKDDVAATGWAAAHHDDVDYSERIVFSDEEDDEPAPIISEKKSAVQTSHNEDKHTDEKKPCDSAVTLASRPPPREAWTGSSNQCTTQAFSSVGSLSSSNTAGHMDYHGGSGNASSAAISASSKPLFSPKNPPTGMLPVAPLIQPPPSGLPYQMLDNSSLQSTRQAVGYLGAVLGTSPILENEAQLQEQRSLRQADVLTAVQRARRRKEEEEKALRERQDAAAQKKLRELEERRARRVPEADSSSGGSSSVATPISTVLSPVISTTCDITASTASSDNGTATLSSSSTSVSAGLPTARSQQQLSDLSRMWPPGQSIPIPPNVDPNMVPQLLIKWKEFLLQEARPTDSVGENQNTQSVSKHDIHSTSESSNIDGKDAILSPPKILKRESVVEKSPSPSVKDTSAQQLEPQSFDHVKLHDQQNSCPPSVNEDAKNCQIERGTRNTRRNAEERRQQPSKQQQQANHLKKSVIPPKTNVTSGDNVTKATLVDDQNVGKESVSSASRHVTSKDDVSSKQQNRRTKDLEPRAQQQYVYNDYNCDYYYYETYPAHSWNKRGGTGFANRSRGGREYKRGGRGRAGYQAAVSGRGAESEATTSQRLGSGRGARTETHLEKRGKFVEDKHREDTTSAESVSEKAKNERKNCDHKLSTPHLHIDTTSITLTDINTSSVACNETVELSSLTAESTKEKNGEAAPNTTDALPPVVNPWTTKHSLISKQKSSDLESPDGVRNSKIEESDVHEVERGDADKRNEKKTRRDDERRRDNKRDKRQTNKPSSASDKVTVNSQNSEALGGGTSAPVAASAVLSSAGRGAATRQPNNGHIIGNTHPPSLLDIHATPARGSRLRASRGQRRGLFSSHLHMNYEMSYGMRYNHEYDIYHENWGSSYGNRIDQHRSTRASSHRGSYNADIRNSGLSRSSRGRVVLRGHSAAIVPSSHSQTKRQTTPKDNASEHEEWETASESSDVGQRKERRASVDEPAQGTNTNSQRLASKKSFFSQRPMHHAEYRTRSNMDRSVSRTGAASGNGGGGGAADVALVDSAGGAANSEKVSSRGGNSRSNGNLNKANNHASSQQVFRVDHVQHNNPAGIQAALASSQENNNRLNPSVPKRLPDFIDLHNIAGVVQMDYLPHVTVDDEEFESEDFQEVLSKKDLKKRKEQKRVEEERNQRDREFAVSLARTAKSNRLANQQETTATTLENTNTLSDLKRSKTNSKLLTKQHRIGGRMKQLPPRLIKAATEETNRVAISLKESKSGAINLQRNRIKNIKLKSPVLLTAYSSTTAVTTASLTTTSAPVKVRNDSGPQVRNQNFKIESWNNDLAAGIPKGATVEALSEAAKHLPNPIGTPAEMNTIGASGWEKCVTEAYVSSTSSSVEALKVVSQNTARVDECVPISNVSGPSRDSGIETSGEMTSQPSSSRSSPQDTSRIINRHSNVHDLDEGKTDATTDVSGQNGGSTPLSVGTSPVFSAGFELLAKADDELDFYAAFDQLSDDDPSAKPDLEHKDDKMCSNSGEDKNEAVSGGSCSQEAEIQIDSQMKKFKKIWADTTTADDNISSNKINKSNTSNKASRRENAAIGSSNVCKVKPQQIQPTISAENQELMLCGNNVVSVSGNTFESNMNANSQIQLAHPLQVTSPSTVSTSNIFASSVNQSPLTETNLLPSFSSNPLFSSSSQTSDYASAGAALHFGLGGTGGVGAAAGLFLNQHHPDFICTVRQQHHQQQQQQQQLGNGGMLSKTLCSGTGSNNMNKQHRQQSLIMSYDSSGLFNPPPGGMFGTPASGSLASHQPGSNNYYVASATPGNNVQPTPISLMGTFGQSGVSGIKSVTSNNVIQHQSGQLARQHSLGAVGSVANSGNVGGSIHNPLQFAPQPPGHTAQGPNSVAVVNAGINNTGGPGGPNSQHLSFQYHGGMFGGQFLPGAYANQPQIQHQMRDMNDSSILSNSMLPYTDYMGTLAGNNGNNSGMINTPVGHFPNLRTVEKANTTHHNALGSGSKSPYPHQQHLLGAEGFGFLAGSPVAPVSNSGHMQQHNTNLSLRSYHQMQPIKMTASMNPTAASNAIPLSYLRHMGQLQQQPSMMPQHQHQQTGQYMSLMSHDQNNLALSGTNNCVGNDDLHGLTLNAFSPTNMHYDNSASGSKLFGNRYSGRGNTSVRGGGRGSGRDVTTAQRHNNNEIAFKQNSLNISSSGNINVRQNSSCVDMDFNNPHSSSGGVGSSRGGGSIRHDGDREFGHDHHSNRHVDKRTNVGSEHRTYSGSLQSTSYVGMGSGDKYDNSSVGNVGGPSGYDTPQFSSATAFMSQLPPSLLQETVMGMREGPRSMTLPQSGGPPLYLMSQRGACNSQSVQSAGGSRGRGGSFRLGRYSHSGDSGPSSTSSVSSGNSGPHGNVNFNTVACSRSSKEDTSTADSTPIEDLSLLEAVAVTNSETAVLPEHFSPTAGTYRS